MYANRRNFRIIKEIGVGEHDGASDFKPEVEILPFLACRIGYQGRYHIPQNVFSSSTYSTVALSHWHLCLLFLCLIDTRTITLKL